MKHWFSLIEITRVFDQSAVVQQSYNETTSEIKLEKDVIINQTINHFDAILQQWKTQTNIKNELLAFHFQVAPHLETIKLKRYLFDMEQGCLILVLEKYAGNIKGTEIVSVPNEQIHLELTAPNKIDITYDEFQTKIEKFKTLPAKDFVNFLINHHLLSQDYVNLEIDPKSINLENNILSFIYQDCQDVAGQTSSRPIKLIFDCQAQLFKEPTSIIEGNNGGVVASWITAIAAITTIIGLIILLHCYHRKYFRDRNKYADLLKIKNISNKTDEGDDEE